MARGWRRGRVPAGVHVAIGGGEKSRVLRHVEAVVVRPDAEDLSRLIAPDKGHDAPLAVSVPDLVDSESRQRSG